MSGVGLVLVTVIFSYVVFKLVQIVFKIVKINKQLKWVPGPKTVPGFGNIFQLLGLEPEDRLLTFKRWADDYGDIYAVWVGHSPIIMVQDPATLQVILKSTVNTVKSPEYKYANDFLCDGLLTGNGEKWHAHRKLLTPSFHLDILEDNIGTVQKNTSILLDKLKPYAESQKPCKINTYLRRFALDVIMETSIGQTINTQDNPSNPYFGAISRMCQLVLLRSFSPIYKMDFFYRLSSYYKEQIQTIKTLHAFSNKAIQNKRELRRQEKLNNSTTPSEPKKSNKKRLALMDKLLELNEQGEVLTTESIRAEIDTFVFAGHDTTTCVTTFTIFLLGHHPEVQDKILEELDAKLPEFSTKPLQLKDIQNLEYLEMVLKESMRVYTPAPIIGRELKTPVQTANGTIPEGSAVLMNIYNTHLNSKYFKDPQKFDPERFSPQNRDTINTFAYIPFSAGPRNCIGQKVAMTTLKVVISTFVKTYKIKSLISRDDITPVANAVLESSPDILVELSPRF